MDQQLISSKLDSLYLCMQRITAKRCTTVEALLADIDIQDILALNITRAIQICTDIASHLIANSSESPPNSMGESFEKLSKLSIIDQVLAEKLRKAVGFRNIAIHNYDAIDWQIVHAICHQHLEHFQDFAKHVSEFCQL